MKKESFGKQPFLTPEGYFDRFPGRLKERIREEENRVPVRRLHRFSGWRIAAVAAVAVIALLIYPLSRMFKTGGATDSYPEMALLEEGGIYDYELAPYLEEEETMDEEEAYVSEAIDYLAMSDVEMDIILIENN